MINKEKISNLLYDILSSANFITNENSIDNRYLELKEIKSLIDDIFKEIENED
jgi:hypothetical protein